MFEDIGEHHCCECHICEFRVEWHKMRFYSYKDADWGLSMHAKKLCNMHLLINENY